MDLFSDFKADDLAAWQARVIADLKEKPLESLNWLHECGFEVSPYFTSENSSSERSPAFTSTSWDIVAHASGSDREINASLLRQLAMGASAVSLPRIGDPAVALKEIRLDCIKSTFETDAASVAPLQRYLASHYSPAELDCTFFGDKVTADSFSAFVKSRRITADGLPFHTVGCPPDMEIAIVLAEVVEKLNATGENAGLHDVAIRTAVTEDIFTSIAKLRALRRLWYDLRSQTGCSGTLHIIAQTSVRDFTANESHNNLIRTSLSAFAAVTGGCDELHVLPFDYLSGGQSALGERLALNQQHLLKEEAKVRSAGDAGCGSFYIEWLTDQLASRAVIHLHDISTFANAAAFTRSSKFNAAVEENNRRETEALLSGKQTVIGLNKFRTAEAKPASHSAFEKLPRAAYLEEHGGK